MRVQNERVALRGTFYISLFLHRFAMIFSFLPLSTQIERKKMQHTGNVVLENISVPAPLCSYSPNTKMYDFYFYSKLICKC